MGKIIIKRTIESYRIDQGIMESVDYDPHNYYQSYRDAYLKADTYMGYRFTVPEIAKYCSDPYKINRMVKDNSLISSYLEPEDIEKLMEEKRATTLANYNELNNYYRLYLGLPPLLYSNNNGIIENPSYIHYNDVPVSGVDITKPVHRYTATERRLFSISGELSNLIKKYPNSTYLNYLDKDIDILTMRDAKEYDVMWYDRTDDKIVRFVDYYRAIRNQFITSHYNEFDAVSFEFYEPLMCVHLIMAAMADYNADIPLERLNSGVIEEKDIYNLFHSFGVPKFDFSYKYLNEIATRINSLAMKKGSKDGLNLVSKMFDEISIFKYFIVKRLKERGNTNLDGLSNEEKYELYFVKAPLNADDPYEYMQDETNILPFRGVVDRDPRWGLGDDKLEKELKNRDFSWSESKYLSLDNKIDISKFSLEMAHFYRYIIEHKGIVEKLKLYLDTVDVQSDLFEIITYLQCLIYKKYKVSPDIPDTLPSVIHMYSIRNQVDYERLKLLFKEHFKYQENKHTIDTFIDLIDGQNYTMPQLMDTFEINYEVLETLYELRSEARNYKDFEMIDSTIRAISFGEKIPALYNNKTDLEDFLSTYNATSSKYILRLNELANDVDPKAAINNEITVVINLLKEQVDSIKHQRLVSLFDTAQSLYSDLDIVKYLEKIIDFYKSYTQDIIDKGVIYSIDDITDGLHILEDIKIELGLNRWELFTASLLFTSDTNEFVRILIDNFKKMDVFQSSEVLSIIENRVNQKIIAYSGFNYTV